MNFLLITLAAFAFSFILIGYMYTQLKEDWDKEFDDEEDEHLGI